MEDSSIGGSFNINGVPLGINLLGNNSIQIFTGGETGVNFGGLNLDSFGVKGLGLEYDFETERLSLFSEISASVLYIQATMVNRGSSSNFYLFFGAKYKNGNSNINLRTNLKNHTDEITETFNSLNPEISRSQYLQFRMDILGRSKPLVSNESTVKYELKRYIIHWQQERDGWEMYKFYEGSDAYDNLKAAGLVPIEKYVKR